MEPPARDDAGHPLGGQRHISQPDAGVNGEVVHALLGLLYQRVAKNVPGEVFGLAVHFFQGLIDWHGADGNGRVAHNPLAGFVNALAGGQVHNGVRAPADGPGHFFDFLADAGGHGGVADVGVYFDEEVSPDDHRLGFGVIDVCGQNGASAGDFIADEFGGDFAGEVCAEILAGVLDGGGGALALQIFADGGEFHFGGDDSALGVGHLGDGGGFGAAGVWRLGKAPVAEFLRGVPAGEFRGGLGEGVGVAALVNPVFADAGESFADVYLDFGVGVGAGGIVDAQGRIDAGGGAGGVDGGGELDLAHRDLDVGPGAGDVDFAGVWQGRERLRVGAGFGADELGFRGGHEGGGLLAGIIERVKVRTPHILRLIGGGMEIFCRNPDLFGLSAFYFSRKSAANSAFGL